MDKINFIKVVFELSLFVVFISLMIIAFATTFKYIIQEKKCNKKIKGKVIGYYASKKRNPKFGIHVPIVEYKVGKIKYHILGPEYNGFKFIIDSKFRKKVCFEELDKQVLLIKKKVISNDNPYIDLCPLDSDVDVFYYDNNPSIAYVNRYCNKKWVFYLEIVCSVLFLLPLLFIYFMK